MYVLNLTELQRDALLSVLRNYAYDLQGKVRSAYSHQWLEVLGEDMRKAESLISAVEASQEQSAEGNSQSNG